MIGEADVLAAAELELGGATIPRATGSGAAVSTFDEQPADATSRMPARHTPTSRENGWRLTGVRSALTPAKAAPGAWSKKVTIYLICAGFVQR
jgi:hypothetical protein